MSGNLEGSATCLAGCFKLKDSAVIWALINNKPATKDIIYGYIYVHANNYDHTGKIKGAVKNTVVDWLQDANVLPVLLAPAALHIGVLGVKDIQIPELTVLWFIMQLIRAKGLLFLRSNLSTNPLVLNPYDILHSWKLLAFI
ncbi:uncharacterized protein P174DRAFT_434356 [Aspergillus novofumigatus IBT 16806]|uniref:Uncharacterized protein n=1 Tax=Aspergillus novofumigatus (strain IBT 16806) TaxID=1392255 RepID=A0A2I1BX19_ASPN1|nr:uncharacterized protein P174DRAFT_434356 [Aspergillus novofumigatus IBT 16806]PKX89917.1 hypothetical protein P174DRAFT_434356 [Aspergillus novofumigatus IBT 16806]